MKLRRTYFQGRVPHVAVGAISLSGNGVRGNARAFSIVELLVVMTLLSLIVLALVAVFNSTQQAFRSSVTQTDVLEGSRATMDLITTDLRRLTPSDGVSNYVYLGNNNYNYGAVNFFATNNTGYAPLVQTLPGSSALRTNLLEWFFVLGRDNTKWTGVGYVVNATNSSPLYPLYRFYAETNINNNPFWLYWAFQNDVSFAQWTNMSHVMDGVVHLVVRPYNPNGYWMTTTYQYNGLQWVTNQNVWFSPLEWGEVGSSFFSNTVPASVELELGVLEDRTLARAESLPFQSFAQLNYLTNQVGRVHLFRQRVTIPNVDPTAYQ